MTDSTQEQLDRIENLLRTLIRQKYGDNLDRLRIEVERRGRMSSKNVREFLNISKQHALTMIEKLARYPGFHMVRGDNARAVPSSITYDASTIIKDQERIIATELLNGDLTLHTIMERFHTDLPGAVLIARNFCATNKVYELAENRVVKHG